MKCPKCGYVTDPFATRCPKCGPDSSQVAVQAKPDAPAMPPPAGTKAAMAAAAAKTETKADKPAEKKTAASSQSGGLLGKLMGAFGKGAKKPAPQEPAPTTPSLEDMPEDATQAKSMMMVGLQPKCMRCGKQLWAPRGGERPDEIAMHSMSRAMFCMWCQHTYCKACAFEAGRKKGQNTAYCPKCNKPLMGE